MPPAIRLDSLSPSTLTASPHPQTVVLRGSGFKGNMRASVGQLSDISGTTATLTHVFATAGAVSVFVKLPNGLRSAAQVVTVTAAAPVPVPVPEPEPTPAPEPVPDPTPDLNPVPVPTPIPVPSTPTGGLQVQYAGLFLVPRDEGAHFGWSFGALTGRRVNGQLRLILAGKNAESGGDQAGLADNPLEISYPGVGPSLQTAPRASLIKNWGKTYQDRLLTSNGGTTEVRGLVYRDGYLWASYGYMYNTAGHHDPSIVAVKLDDATGQATAYGPWRTTEHSQRTRGYMVPLPNDPAYGGRTIAVGAPLTSGAANCPVGSSLVALPPITPDTTPPDVPDSPHATLDCLRLVYHDADHPQERSGQYKICGWTVADPPYDCSRGSYVIDGPPNFGNEFWVRRDSGSIRDKITASAWVKTATQQGVVFFGEITDVIPGYVYPSDGMPHLWYGPERPCCHGHVPIGGSGTGPRSSSQVGMLFTYDPTDLARAAQGQIAPWSFPAIGAVQLHAIAPTIPQNLTESWNFGGAWFDEVEHLLFVSQIHVDTWTDSYSPRPVIHVFRVT